jgi:hypothetical protein
LVDCTFTLFTAAVRGCEEAVRGCEEAALLQFRFT